MNKKKIALSLVTSALLLGALSPTLVSAHEYSVKTSVEEKSIQVNEEKLTQDIVKSIKLDLQTRNQNLLESPITGVDRAPATGLLATLAAKYGMVWVKTKLPGIIYSKVSGIIGGVVSFEKFTSILKNSLTHASEAALNRAIASALKSAGVKSSTAETAAGIIAGAVVIFV